MNLLLPNKTYPGVVVLLHLLLHGLWALCTRQVVILQIQRTAGLAVDGLYLTLLVHHEGEAVNLLGAIHVGQGAMELTGVPEYHKKLKPKPLGIL
jgi:hypothetical protein